MKSLILIFSVVLLCASANAQHLPDLPNKPVPQFENPSFCPSQGTVTGMADPELNKHKNRVDSSPTFYPVNFNEIKTLVYPATAGSKVRSTWTPDERAAIEKYEGIPIVIEGFLALVNNAHQGQPPLIQGARPEGKESCNCGSTQPNQIDFHIWLLNAAAGNRKDSIVVEMTPRVRAHHSTWIVSNLTIIANHHFPVRIYGWLMFDGQHPEQVGGTRATLWEIHPIIQVQYREGGVWKNL